jgi:hypothetical protein
MNELAHSIIAVTRPATGSQFDRVCITSHLFCRIQNSLMDPGGQRESPVDHWDKDSTSITIYGKIKPPFESESEYMYGCDTD